MHKEDGFTLPELVIVTAVLILGLIGTLILLRPEKTAQEDFTAQRRLGVARIMQILHSYKQDTGSLPDDFPAELTPIASLEENGYDLCRVVVPAYAKDLPIDPVIGVKVLGEDETTTASCNAEGIDYVSGYFVMRNAKGIVTVTAIDSETGKQYKLERSL